MVLQTIWYGAKFQASYFIENSQPITTGMSFVSWNLVWYSYLKPHWIYWLASPVSCDTTVCFAYDGANVTAVMQRHYNLQASEHTGRIFSPMTWDFVSYLVTDNFW